MFSDTVHDLRGEVDKVGCSVVIRRILKTKRYSKNDCLCVFGVLTNSFDSWVGGMGWVGLGGHFLELGWGEGERGGVGFGGNWVGVTTPLRPVRNF